MQHRSRQGQGLALAETQRRETIQTKHKLGRKISASMNRYKAKCGAEVKRSEISLHGNVTCDACKKAMGEAK